jgi:hypothetical protein
VEVLLFLLFIVALVGAWVSRGRYERGTAARRVATGVAVALSLVGLTAVGFAVMFIIAINSWANSK